MPNHFWRLLLSVCMSLCLALPAAARDQPNRHLYAVGGGYDKALEGFAAEVIRHARGPKVRMVMVPAAFADDPVLPEDPIILAEDVKALQLACDAVLNRITFPGGCDVGSVPLYIAADAYQPAILARLSDPTVDGIFFTGGDQGYAMRILAGTPSEAAMDVAAERGVVFGGTSAGAAIQSLVMNAGYTDAGDSTNALQKASIDLWLGRPSDHRGLRFGSRQSVIDEHVHSRGRLGRMINASAQTADALGQGGLLGLGFDYDTGAAITNDRWLTAVSGVSSAVVVDLRSARARHRWVGPNAALSARRVLTHVLSPNRRVALDLATREPHVAGRPLPFDDRGRDEPRLRAGPGAALMLGGDVSEDLGGPVIREFVRQASRRDRLGKMVVIAAGYPSAVDAQAAADLYAQALVKAGWRGSTRIHLQGQTRLDFARARDAAGVLLVGGDQSLLAGPLADREFVDWVATAARHADVVMLERAMAAAAGEHFDAIAEGDTADDAINAFRTDNAVIRPGLGLVAGAAFEPRLQIDKRWGRLYGIGRQRRHLPVYGISESSAIVIDGRRAGVIGLNPVVGLDPRGATFYDGDNGAFGALNVLLDVYQPGEGLQDR
jgi:cyanophycinase